MTAPTIDLSITRGKTFEFAFLYSTGARIYRPITAMPGTTPVRLTVPGHGLPDGWPVRIACVRAPLELNTPTDDPPIPATVIDADTLELNSLSGTCWRPYRTGGVLVYQAPFDLTGCHARATVRDRVGGQRLLAWSSGADGDPGSAIELDAETSQIVLTLDADTTAALPWHRGVYEVELIDRSGRVYPVTGISKVNVSREVATP